VLVTFGCTESVLSAPHRLKKNRDFAVVHQQGTRCSSAHLVLRVRLRQAQSCSSTTYATSVNSDCECPNPVVVLPTRFGVAVSQKVSKRSVVRNRIKRQLRAICRKLLPEIVQGFDVVIIVRSTATGCDYPKFLQELKQLLVEAEILHGY
jgi:ribonuclease P protein component